MGRDAAIRGGGGSEDVQSGDREVLLQSPADEGHSEALKYTWTWAMTSSSQVLIGAVRDTLDVGRWMLVWPDLGVVDAEEFDMSTVHVCLITRERGLNKRVRNLPAAWVTDSLFTSKLTSLEVSTCCPCVDISERGSVQMCRYDSLSSLPAR